MLSSTDTTPYGLNTATQTVTVTVDQGTPVVASATPGDPSSSTGIVTGITAFANTAGRTLTYSTAGTSTGGGSIAVDPTTGAFTYTPTQSQRQAAGLSTTDTFTTTADNGVRTTSQTITVTVDPGTSVAGSALQMPELEPSPAQRYSPIRPGGP